MKFNYSRNTVAMGREGQMRDQDKAPVLATADGVDKVREPMRKAGDRLAKFNSFMDDADSAQNNQDWNNKFKLSNEGAAFNMAKMNGGQLPQEGQGNA